MPTPQSELIVVQQPFQDKAHRTCGNACLINHESSPLLAPSALEALELKFLRAQWCPLPLCLVLGSLVKYPGCPYYRMVAVTKPPSTYQAA